MTVRAIIVTLLFAAGAGHARQDEAAGRLEIRADVDSALVMLDGAFVGRTPYVSDSLAPGVHRIRVLHPDITGWLAAVASDTVRISGGESRTLLFSLRPHLQILSSPAEAGVYARGALAGLTPLIMSPERLPDDSLLTLRKAGYTDALVDPRGAVEGILRVQLVPDRNAPAGGISPFLPETGGIDSRATRLYMSAGATVVSGIFAAYFKTLADDRQMEYLMTGDASKLVQRHRYDISAAIALLTAQATFVLFCYLLLGD
jgi:hypothetical protein